MSKAIKFFKGNDTTGRNVQLAKSESGHWYGRSFEFNGYGKAWSKWFKTEPELQTTYINQITGEEGTYETPVMCWGFQKMTELDEIPRVRLPK